MGVLDFLILLYAHRFQIVLSLPFIHSYLALYHLLWSAIFVSHTINENMKYEFYSKVRRT